MNSKDIFNNRYVLEKLLGSGAFAEVWLATDMQTNLPFALKIYAPATGLPDDGIKMLTHEFSIMANVSHQNLLTPKYYDIYNNCPFLILQYCSQGNIERHVGHFSEQQAWQLLRDAASGLAYLHAMHPPVLHQDIKPANILINDNGQFMLTDFGVSTKARASLSKATKGDASFISAGTIPYMAPERFSSQNMPIMANDIYSLGVTTFEMLTSYLPFGEHGGLLQKNGADVPELPEGQFSKALSDVLCQCMQAEPEKRPFASELAAIANDVLAQMDPTAATIRMKPFHIDPNQNNTVVTPKKQANRSWLRWLLGCLMVILVAAVAVWQLSPSKPDVPVPEPSSTVLIDTTEQTVKDDIATTTVDDPKDDMKKEESKANDQAKEERKAKTDTETRSEQATKEQEPQKQPQSTKQQLDLGYATYQGETLNGKPHGSGTLTFRVDHRLDSNDDERRIAESGDRVVGDFYKGHLDNGTWYHTDGSSEPVIIGH